jgi:hypothetical protein
MTRFPTMLAPLLGAVALGALSGSGDPVRADVGAAMQAYERQEYATAAEEFQRLAEQGDPQAQHMLGRMYARGQGVVQDYVRAHMWLNLAAAGAIPDATDARSQLEQRMTPDQVAEAQQLARDFQAQMPARDVAGEALFDEPELTSREVMSGIQQALNERGYDAGPTDGVLGPKTRSAIEDYQADAGLQVTGRPSEALVERLGIDVAGDFAAPGPTVAAPGPEQASDTWPWRRLIVRDNFEDGNYTEDPSWTVAAGEFLVGRNNNLRSVHQIPTAEEDSGETQEPDFGQIATAVLGAVLQGALGGDGLGRAPGRGDAAEIYLSEAIPSGFAIEFDLRALEATGAIALGPYRGADRGGGYRLAWIGRDQPRLELHDLDAESSEPLASYSDPGLADGGVHRFVWTRTPQGRMEVRYDGEPVMSVDAPADGEGFDGFTLRNLGGEYALHRIAIYGAG